MRKLLIQSLLWLSLPVALAAEMGKDAVFTSGTGRPKVNCRDDLPVLSVGSDNILTREKWDKFKKKYPMFVLGVADSSQPSMCDTEPLLSDLQANFETGRFTYPVKKKNKEERKPITVARIDAADKKQIEKFRAIGVEFGMLPQVLIVKNGELFRYDGLFSNFENIFFMMQIMAKPLVELKFEDHIHDFLETSEPGIYNEDYRGGLLKPGDVVTKNFNGFVKSIGYMTRAVAMFYNQDEYKEEIAVMTKAAERLAVRMNLRIAIVTDKELINKMKKKHPMYFDSDQLSKSSLVLRRYDGEVFQMNLSSSDTNSYNWWINTSSKKPVDDMNHGAFQLAEVSNMPSVILYVSFDKSNPKQLQRCMDAIQVLTNMASQYREYCLIFYTDDKHQLAQRKNLGITWDTLPSMALSTTHQILYAYGKDLPFNEYNVEQWFASLKTGKAKPVTQIGEAKDSQFYENWLSNTELATRESWEDELLKNREHDIAIFLFSSENVSYQQRGFAYQYSLAVEKIMETEANTAIKVIKFFSYDIGMHGFPKGIVRGTALPEDTDGSMDGTYEVEMAVLPRIVFLPARDKGMPYRVFFGEAVASEIINFIVKHAQNNLKVARKQTLSSLADFGRTEDIDERFYRRLASEGIHIEKLTRSFVYGGFMMVDNAEKMIPKKKDKDKSEEEPVQKEAPKKSDEPRVEDYEEL